MGAKRDGTITAFHAKIVADLGAYHMLLTPTIPSFGGVRDERRATTIPAVQTDIIGVFTNKFADRRHPRRGPARGDAHDRGDAWTSSPPSWAWTRSSCGGKNFIPPDDFPHETAIGVVYDSGNYHGHARQAARARRRRGLPREQERLRAEGVYRGIGFSHLHGDLRPRARRAWSARAGFGLQAGLLGVGDGARAHRPAR